MLSDRLRSVSSCSPTSCLRRNLLAIYQGVAGDVMVLFRAVPDLIENVRKPKVKPVDSNPKLSSMAGYPPKPITRHQPKSITTPNAHVSNPSKLPSLHLPDPPPPGPPRKTKEKERSKPEPRSPARRHPSQAAKPQIPHRAILPYFPTPQTERSPSIGKPTIIRV